ncbi:DUF1345 domain-containing protein [Micromonospora sp. NPDC005203]|uniref:DUF1345 domain-containing protein n=1 Tax=Micromonospora sp. NPDC005203 TaxID=3364226 RepID=UPI0036A1908C
MTPLVIWTFAAGAILVWVWRACWSASPRRTEQLAEAEHQSSSTDAAILIASAISLAAVAAALVRASGQQDMVAVTLVILSVVAVVLAGALVNTVFAFKYARLYYRDDGGIDFKREELLHLRNWHSGRRRQPGHQPQPGPIVTPRRVHCGN